ncbi:MAG: hypothetical protein U1A25_00250 [Candidatus Sungbacteria bacterium]|nr:hypothetical protein [bacterium]MDZ4260074.1 hypothetical protein [Candidatus Sungbacteria bacterium]
MSRYSAIDHMVPIQCCGRDEHGREVLGTPVCVMVHIRQPAGDEKNIHMSVVCPFNTGGHGQRCKASHPSVDKVGNGIPCPYSIDIPYVIDQLSY